MTNQTYIIVEQTVGKADDSDATMADLEQLSDDVIDIVYLAARLRPLFRLLALVSRYFQPRWQMAGVFRLAQFDEDGNEVRVDEPDQVIDELGLDR